MSDVEKHNRADRRAAAKTQRRCRHYWVSKADYPERGTWCLDCGLRKDEQ